MALKWIKLKVTRVSQTNIPNVYLVKFESERPKISLSLEVPKKVQVFNEGETVEWAISGEPQDVDNAIFHAVGYVYRIDESHRRLKMAISMGGLQVRIDAPSTFLKPEYMSSVELIFRRV